MNCKYNTLVFFLFLSSSLVFGQKKDRIFISGTVTDSLKNPIKNAIIFLDDYKTNEVTNRKGDFIIRVEKLPESISAFSEEYGFQTSECCENDEATIRFGPNSLKNGKFIELLSSFENKKRKAKPEQIFTNIFDYLRVNAPMLRISGTNQIRVAGYDTSFNASSEPLFIVNGSPTSNISDVIPTNIKNVTILKGGNAASYGVRGANGVIIITTN